MRFDDGIFGLYSQTYENRREVEYSLEDYLRACSDDAAFYAGPAERLRTPFGEASAWKLKLAISEVGGKPQGRNIALWMSDDARRLPMKLQAELPIGSFSLILRDAK